MIMLDGRRREWGWALEPVLEHRAAAFVGAPAVVLGAPQQVRVLAQILSVLADPDLTALPVARDAPRIAQSIGPGFRSCVGQGDERVVCGHEIGLSGRCAIDVD